MNFLSRFAFSVVPLSALVSLIVLAPGVRADAAGAKEQPATASLVERVAAAFEQQTHGIFGFRTHATVHSAERVLPHDQVDDAWLVYEDGHVVRSGGGSPDGPASAEIAAHQPYDARYIGEYRYAPAPCAGCAAGAVAIAYDGIAHDAVHGRGVLVVDPRTARVLTSTTQPYVVPKPARSGSLTTTWGATPAGWFPVATTGTFSGRVGPFSGRATLTQQFTAYGRFHDVAEAQRALLAGAAQH